MPKLLLAAVLLLVSVNVLVLAGVAYNRSGEPVLRIELTERELPVHRSFADTDENSGTSLDLKWQVFNPDEDNAYGYSNYTTPPWLDHKKLSRLGFDIERLERTTKDHPFRLNTVSTDVIVVLEYQGETYREALNASEQKLDSLRDKVLDHPEDEEIAAALSKYEDQLERSKLSGSRLYAVDAGPGLQTLMKQYPGQGRYMFARGEITLSWNDDAIEGRIRQILIDNVHVPLPMSQALSKLSLENRPYRYDGEVIPPRYKVLMNLGQRLEPWIESVVYTDNKS